MADQTTEKPEAPAPAPASDVAAVTATDDKKADEAGSASTAEAKPEGKLDSPVWGARCCLAPVTATVAISPSHAHATLPGNCGNPPQAPETRRNTLMDFC